MRKRWTLTYSPRHPQAPAARKTKIPKHRPSPSIEIREQYFKSNIDSPTLGYQATHEIAKLSFLDKEKQQQQIFWILLI